MMWNPTERELELASKLDDENLSEEEREAITKELIQIADEREKKWIFA